MLHQINVLNLRQSGLWHKEYNILMIFTVNIRLISMDICNPGNFLNTFGGACWIDNYMGIDDNNCILCFLKPVIMIRYSC